MKQILKFWVPIVVACVLLAFNQRLNALEERTKFICSLPVITNKSVLLLQEREGKWVLDSDMQKSFYYVPSGC